MAILKRMVSAFQQAIGESEGIAAACFNPRHAFRVKFQNKTYDMVICYECFQVDLFEEGKQLKQVLTSGSAQTVLDGVLRQAGVPLGERPK